MIDIHIIVPDSIAIAFFKAIALPLANVLQTCHILKLQERQWKPSNLVQSTFEFCSQKKRKKKKQQQQIEKERTDCFLTGKATRCLTRYLLNSQLLIIQVSLKSSISNF